MISSGTAFSEADRIVMQKPVQIHTPTTIRARVLIWGVERNAIGLPPKAVMIAFSNPIWTWRVP
jgi:hypothetical protein